MISHAKIAILSAVILVIGIMSAQNIWAYKVEIYAQKTERYGYSDVGEVYMGPTIMLRFFTELNGKTPMERAEETALHLQQMIALGLTEKDIRLYPIENNIEAKVYDVILFTITDKEAKINKTPKDRLAKEWLANLKNMFNQIPGYRITDYSLWDIKNSLPLRGYAKIFTPALFEEKSYFMAGHPYFPLGTKLRITNPAKSWTVVAVVEERVPYNKNIAILLEPAAGYALGITTANAQFVIIEEVK